ncbi:DUF4931 domain-containing protein [Brevibacillus fulvus]|uniref:Galactose-1-phosphate uridylyltransferase n=1 Tax=Brevibacillus fulvus TaxID=1125967 RepID=A0A939BRY5_9BACL|nr:DUF4931 domain-containing protein [Brevibacillus fulvus]MBM7589923.1 galactose-1-phosphate uridylyltransferase [Brevibacillus fulvus]
MQSHMIFNTSIGRQKPETIINRQHACPFCEREQLDDIIDQRGSIILVKNKYPVLLDTFPTVLIETDECDSELSIYDKDHLHDLFAFGVEHWLRMEQSGDYRSVIFFKNHGPLSGGSIRHPHMQISGLKHYDYRLNIAEEQFRGVLIDRQPGVECNISTHPRISFYEYNVLLSDFDQLPKLADYVQMLVRYVVQHRKISSYNLFFYQLQETIAVKVIPRFPTSPLAIGYGIKQVSNNLDEVAAEIQQLYL